MSESILRVDLPSGGWWEILTRPQQKHVRQWALHWQGEAGPDLADHALASLTTAWSFVEQVSPAALSRRDAGDLIAVLEAFLREVVPFLDEDRPRSMAEELFAALLVGQVPQEFDEIQLMAATGWSWQTLQETPADIVQRMAIYLAVKQTRETRGALDFPDREDE